MAEAFKKLAPHQSGFSLNRPFEVNSDCWLPKPIIATINNWVHDPEHNNPDPVKEQRMRQMFMSGMY